jgi:hypothetical protein
MTLTSSPLTFVDLTDQLQLSIYITSNLPTVQIKDTNSNDATYNPNWASTPLILTPKVLLNQKDIALSDVTINWKRKDGNNDETALQTGEIVSNGILTVNANNLVNTTSNMITYVCNITYTDEQLGATSTATTQLTYTLVTNGENTVVLTLQAQEGMVFSDQCGYESITLDAIAFRGVTNITATEYKWSKYSEGKWTNISDSDLTTPSQLTVTRDEITNVATFKCEMTYRDVTYAAYITLKDETDPYFSEILTVGGNIFKNGQGGSAAYIVVRSNSKEVDPLVGPVSNSNPDDTYTYWYDIDIQKKSIVLKTKSNNQWINCSNDPQTFEYTWSLMKEDGSAKKFNDGNLIKTGKVIYISCDDIDSVGTLQCEVKKKR